MLKKILFNIARNNSQRVIYNMNKVKVFKTSKCIKEEYMDYILGLKYEILNEDLMTEIINKREEYIHDLEDNYLLYLVEVKAEDLSFSSKEWEAKRDIEYIFEMFDKILENFCTDFYDDYTYYRKGRDELLLNKMSKFDNKKYSVDK